MITEEQVMKHFKEIKEVLDQHSIPFWLEDGTLLGAVRDGRMIPWDHDIDLGSFKESFQSKEIRKSVSRQLENKGFSIYFFPNSIGIYGKDFHTDIILIERAENKRYFIVSRFLSQNSISHLLVKLHKLSKASFYGKPRLKNIAGARDLIKTNFFFIIHSLPSTFKVFFYKSARNLLSQYEKTKYYILQIEAKHFQKLKTIHYGDHKVHIPNAVEHYLKKKYGDWRTPPKDPSKWKWYEVGDWPKVETLLNRKNIKDL